MNKKIFLNVIFFSLITVNFTRCEFVNSKTEKSICTNKSPKSISTWRKFLFTPVGFGLITLTLFVGTNIYNEWVEGRKLTFIERELQMVNINLAWLIGFAFWRDFGSLSPQSNQVPNQKTPEEHTCNL